MAKKQRDIEVIWTSTAEKQLFHIIDYWTDRNQSTSYSEKLLKAIWKKIEIIKDFPNSSRATDFPNTRNAVLGHFSILYKLKPGEIIITAIWDNRDNPKKLLEILKP